MSGQYNGSCYTETRTCVPQIENFYLGYVPGKIEVENITSGASLVWSGSMASGESQKTVAAGTRTFLSTGGIAILDGSDGVSKGFRIPTALADINDTASEVLHVRVWRNAQD